MGNAPKIDINEEYEKLVPLTIRESLFDESDDYESLRQYIIDHPKEVYQKDLLPFSEIKVTNYVEFRKQGVIDKESSNGKHLFFIKQSVKGQADFCDAAGYYISATNEFVILPFSYIIKDSRGYIPIRHSRKGNKDGKNLYIVSQLDFSTPEDAASFVLGRRADLEEWIDSRGKGLLTYYKKLAKQNPLPSSGQIDSQRQKTQQQTPLNLDNKRIFCIREEGVCDVSGFYDTDTGYFYILEDSKIALHVDKEFEASPTGQARKRLLSSRCIEADGYYIVQKDAKCRNATAAACYAMGKEVTYIEWETKDGMALKDYYPNKFFNKKSLFERLFKPEKNAAAPAPVAPPKPEPVVEDGSNHPFFILKYTDQGMIYDAKGYYDKVNKKFILTSGSCWSKDVTKEYQFTASEMLRRNEIKKSCRLENGVYRQFRDVLCDSPSQAASFVLGRSANGWEEWRDVYTDTLKEVYKGESEEEVKKKVIADVVTMLQSPISQVLSALENGSGHSLHGLLKAIMDY